MNAGRFAPLVLLAMLAASTAPGCSSPPARGASERLADEPPPSDAGSGRALDLLAGHLTMQVPASAATSPRQVSIMAAPVGNDDETRVILEPGDGELARFVMVVTELHLLGTGDVVADAAKLAAKGEHATPLDGAAMKAAELESSEEPPGDHPIFLLSAIVAHPDGTLQEAEFYILPDMKAERVAYAARALSMAKTIAPGTKTIDFSARTAEIGSALQVDVPNGYVVAAQPGPDFDVYWVRKMVHPGEKGATVGFYVGGNPSYQYAQSETQSTVASSPGTLLGQKTTWYTWTSNEGIHTREAMTGIQGGETLHAFAFAADDASVAELSKIVDTLRSH